MDCACVTRGTGDPPEWLTPGLYYQRGGDADFENEQKTTNK
jgi:hypothetical protein